ncbi:MAG: DUF1232 domain-containing protein [Deltaproteobacteria bacterium]|nr:DUF1232 domain-containing protein [Deltaproteobacteria bacterium]
MTDVKDRCLETFPSWLRTLAEDAEGLLAVLESAGSSESVRRTAASGINYLFKSLDLVPDGIDDIGFLDDAFVLRVTGDLIAKEDSEIGKRDAIGRLANDCGLIREFLGPDYGRLEAYVVSLKRGAARGRSVQDIVTTADVLRELGADVRSFAKGYQVPSFSREEKNLIKLKAFFDAKLPR